ncbi:MAG: hypothetical protein SFY56_09030 [Bacteroidota bacterium]|nr:hypothetical protein [Bacteroidota bacterium]
MKRVFIVLFFISTVCFSQKIDKQNALFTIRGNVGIPRTISSKMFSKSFNGVYEGNLSANVRLFDNFFVGLGYQHSSFLNREEVFVFYRANNGALAYNTRLLCHSGYLKLGYDKFFSEIGYASFCVNTGIMFNKYTNINSDTSTANSPFPTFKFITPYFQPETSINFIVEKSLSFSIFVNYSTMLYKFDPKAPRFNQVEEVHSKPNNYFISYFSFGFGFNVLINSKSKSSTQ